MPRSILGLVFAFRVLKLPVVVGSAPDFFALRALGRVCVATLASVDERIVVSVQLERWRSWLRQSRPKMRAWL